MSRRTDKVIDRITASLDEKIRKWEAKVETYTEYQETYGGYKYADQIEEYSEDIKVLQGFRAAMDTVRSQKGKIDDLEERNRGLKALVRKTAEKLTGYGEFEVLIRQLKQEADR